MEERVSEESAPSMKLSLGIGAGDLDDDDRHVFPQLTETQLHELKQQALIFKYIVAGLPVPLDLVVPIWHSVASSSLVSFSGADIYRQIPSCKSIFFSLVVVKSLISWARLVLIS